MQAYAPNIAPQFRATRKTRADAPPTCPNSREVRNSHNSRKCTPYPSHLEVRKSRKHGEFPPILTKFTGISQLAQCAQLARMGPFPNCQKFRNSRKFQPFPKSRGVCNSRNTHNSRKWPSPRPPTPPSRIPGCPKCAFRNSPKCSPSY